MAVPMRAFRVESLIRAVSDITKFLLWDCEPDEVRMLARLRFALLHRGFQRVKPIRDLLEIVNNHSVRELGVDPNG